MSSSPEEENEYDIDAGGSTIRVDDFLALDFFDFRLDFFALDFKLRVVGTH